MNFFKSKVVLLVWFLSVIFTTQALAQVITVTGTVSDELGEPMPGVSVHVRGTVTGALTGADGSYRITVPDAEAQLQFSFVGYITAEFTVGSMRQIDVVLTEDLHQFDEVVVIGYGTARRSDLSTAVSTMNVDQAMRSRPANLNTLMQGRLPGLTIQSSGGDPLAGAVFNIRGKGSRDGDGILWVVDGVPGAPYNIEDIASISVLKDAASAAIYGASVGSGGVIIITTKQAQEGKIKVNVNVSHSFQSPWRLPETLTSEEFCQVWADAVESSVTRRQIPFVADPTRYPYGNVTRTDWIDEVFRTGHLQHYSVSLSGGSDRLKGYGSFSYDKNEGVMLNTHREQIGARLNLDFQIAPWLKLQQRGYFQYTNGQGDVWNNSHEGVLIAAIFYPRAATVYEHDQDGNLVMDEFGQPLYGGTIPRWAVAEGVSGYGEIRNPVASLERMRQQRPSANIYSTTSLEIRPWRGLIFRSDYTTFLRPSRYEVFNPIIYEFGRPNPQNSREVTSTWRTGWFWENTLTYAEAFGNHLVTAMVGSTMRKDHQRWNGVTTYNFDREDPTYTIFPNSGDWNTSRPGESIWNESMTSVFGRIDYSFDDRYFLTASLRRDASSKLWHENNSGIFPAFSGAWKISSESFFDVRFINLLKVRGSWGQVGNVALVPRFSYNADITTTSWPKAIGLNMDDIFGKVFSTVANRNLIWETTEQTSIGIDATVLSNSLNFSIDYFHKTTKDLIDRVPALYVPSEPWGNIGEVLNTGWEFSADYRRRINRDLTVNVFGNFNTVKSEVKDIGHRTEFQHGTVINALRPLRSKPGYPWYSFVVLETDGIFQSHADIEAHRWTNPETGAVSLIQPNAQPGDLKFIDHNDDGIINDNDQVYKGSFLPTVTYAFGASVDYKGFDFSFFFQGIAGNKIFNGFKMMGYTGRGQGNNLLADVLNSWTYNKSSDIPRLAVAEDPNGNYSRASDFLLEKGDYLRLKNVTLGYTLPQTVMQNIGMNDVRLRVYVGAENLLTFTQYTGFDPEVTNYGIDAGVYPVARSFNIGLNLNF